MKSLRQLTDDLLGIRLQATNVSMWQIQATLTERARRAINDAIATYEATIEAVYNSLPLTGQYQVVGIPHEIGKIVRIEAVTSSGTSRHQVNDWQHVPTAFTNLVYIRPRGTHEWLNADPEMTAAGQIIFESKHYELPTDLAVMGTSLTATAGLTATVAFTGGTGMGSWPEQGYFELTIPWAATDRRELVHYNNMGVGVLSNLERGLESGTPVAWTQGSLISAVYAAADKSVPVIMKAAQATMYEFFVRNRALYDQYTSISAEQGLDVEGLIQLSNAYEIKADRAYRRLKQPPQPTTARIRRRRP